MLFMYFPLLSTIISFIIIAIVSSSTITLSDNNNNNDDNGEINFNLSTKENIELYFRIKRKQQLNAVQTLLNYDRYDRQYQMVDKLFEKIFTIIDESQQQVINNSNYNIGDQLPLNQTEIVRNILQVIDNCAFFANIVLKLPDISRRLLDKRNGKSNDWAQSYRWCLNFTTNSNIVDDLSLKMFNLAAQQLNIVEKEADFLNPYEKKNQKSRTSSNSIIKDPVDKKKKNSKTKSSKGPRMSRIEL
ncbi:hypothetical protein DERF_013856 [Dermatophagoides farinae]|uniref:Coiled-coil domain-containing protein 134-like n=1 Tax=Dermatophagoides farinae TaxID=6954 RepID=A0A922HNB6_DERFA|nr:hypothetical protein DERF_013856 [Dermatophagoides farinae]